MSIVFIARNKEIGNSYRHILPDNQENVLVIESSLNQAIPDVQRLEEQGAEVFVARGGSAMFLRQAGIKSPIVEIHLTSSDIVQALEEAKSICHFEDPFIAVVAYENMIKNLFDFLPFLNVRLSFHTFNSEEEAPSVIRTAIAQGAQIILGGAITVKIAGEFGFPAVLMRSGESAIRTAYEEAQRIVYARRLEATRSSELKAMLEYAHEGIIAVNSKDWITVFNPAAETVTGVQASEALGRPAQEKVPFLHFEEILKSGIEDIGQITDCGQSKVMMNRIPVRVQGQIVGAIATFQNITRIQSMEARIRKEIYSQGHVAKFSFQDILGRSPALQETIETAKSYAEVDSTVLIHGETGAGKELFAQGIHRHSIRRSGQPFVAINCAALPETLLESELFGYVEGAFTGARRQGKPGLFELAHHGTIFLDEVSEIPLSLQGRLLRVLQEREVVRLGHDRVIPVDVRVLCATNRQMEKLVEEGKFRNDLYWRLNVLSLNVPPLRERQGDIRFLIESFLQGLTQEVAGFSNFTKEALDFLTIYPWPGNVRELKNFCERLTVGSREKIWDESFVRRLLDQAGTLPVAPKFSRDERIKNALAKSGGKIDQAAKILGVHRSTLWRRLKRTDKEQKVP
ncbi:MAG: Propionate catabolism operon regulatory protein [Smithella sp. PtaU1.Bin162]|nr:MAG: Propionate catabolism operon regulatory protein [Smithella sp. PtaU1.Bin162]